MYCPNCGTPNTQTARFCERCGGGLAAAPAGPPPGLAIPAGGPVLQPQPSPQPQAQWQPVAEHQQVSQPAAWQPAPQPQTQWQGAQAGAAHAMVQGDPRVRGALVPTGGMAVAGKSPGVALLLSFLIPGVGQLYNGDTKKGATMLVAYFVSWGLTAIVIGLIGVFGIWVWSMVDAYNVASGKARTW